MENDSRSTYVKVQSLRDTLVRVMAGHWYLLDSGEFVVLEQGARQYFHPHTQRDKIIACNQTDD